MNDLRAPKRGQSKFEQYDQNSEIFEKSIFLEKIKIFFSKKNNNTL